MSSIYDRKLKFFGTRGKSGLTKDLFGTVPGKRSKGSPKTRMFDDLKEIADISIAELQTDTESRSMA